MRRITKTVGAVGVCGGLGAVAVFTVSVSASGAGSGGANGAVQAAAVGAIEAYNGIVGSDLGSATQLSAPASQAGLQQAVARGASKLPMTATASSRQLAAWSSLENRYFVAGAQAASMVQVIMKRTASGEEVKNLRTLGAGVSGVKITSAAVDGSSASVDANVENWLALAVNNGGVWTATEPVGDARYDLTLRLKNGSWLINSMNITVTNGP